MIGIIVTGHGQFAEGLTSSIRLIAGEPQCYATINFLQNHSLDQYRDEFIRAMDSMKECEGIIVFCDLVNSTPYRIAVEIKAENPNIEIIAGVNLGMLMEVSITRTFEENLKTLAQKAMDAGKEQIVRYPSL